MIALFLGRRSLALPLATLLGLAACDRQPAPPTGASPAPPTSRMTRPIGVDYIESVTGGADRSEALPMVIAIHGLGDRPESFGALLSDLDVKARIITPRGLAPYHDGHSWFPLRREIAGDDVAQGILRAADTLAATLRRLVAERPTRGKPIVTGFSQGGALSFALALHHPDVVGAAFPIGGWLPPSIRPAEGSAIAGAPAIVALHGEADTRVPVGPTSEAVDALRARGVSASLRTFPGAGHSISAEMRRALLELIRGATSAPL